MNRQIVRLGIGLAIAYAALFVQLNIIQVFSAEEFNEHEENSRPLVDDFGAPRGEIRAADGIVLARSVELEDGVFERQRVYPQGALFAEVTGYFSFGAGADGLELAWDDELRGDENELSDGLRELLGGESTTADVNLTMSLELQRVASEALGPRRGSVVMLDAQSGAIEALWSWPSFDPNVLSSVDTVAAQQARDRLLADPDNPLLSRTTEELFFPGSTFKVVTAAAALDRGVVDLDAPVFANVTEYTPPLTTNALSNFGDGQCGGALRDLIRRSCNAGMAQLAVELLGAEPLVDTAEAFGFNDVPPLEVPGVVASTMPTDFGADLGVDAEIAPELLDQLGDNARTVPLTDNAPALAQSGIGQFDVKATPLQMALIAAAIANDGEVPNPHLVKTVVDSEGSVLHRADLSPWRTATSALTAADLRETMVAVVTGGTGQRIAVDGLVVGAKTGTAQLAGSLESTHAWVIAFAGDTIDRPDLALAVIVEADEVVGEQTGGRVAGPIAKALIEAWAANRAP